MSITLGELARLLGGELHGDASTVVTGAATLEVVKAGQITLADHPDRFRSLEPSPAVAAIVPSPPPVDCKPTIVVNDVHAAFAQAVLHFRPPRPVRRAGHSPRADISDSARIGQDVEIHAGVSVGDDVVLGDGVTLHSGVRVLPGCVIGRGTTLFPNVVLYDDTRIGQRCLIHAGAVLGAYGFGYRQRDGAHELSAQLGNVEIGDDVEIGAGTTIDRGTYGPTTIGNGTKIDNLVMIAHNCRIGCHNLICSQVGIAGSTSTGDGVVMAGQVGVRDHVHIGSDAVLCSKSGISNDVPDGEVVLGQPATPVRQQKVQMAAVSKLPEMRRQFRQLQRDMQEIREQMAATLDPSPQDSKNQEQAA
jgi:UDP-3-O-[3-hydroxymyristoyl] glucosamine N-acyltransferase